MSYTNEQIGSTVQFIIKNAFNEQSSLVKQIIEKSLIGQILALREENFPQIEIDAENTSKFSEDYIQSLKLIGIDFPKDRQYVLEQNGESWFIHANKKTKIVTPSNDQINTEISPFHHVSDLSLNLHFDDEDQWEDENDDDEAKREDEENAARHRAENEEYGALVKYIKENGREDLLILKEYKKILESNGRCAHARDITVGNVLICIDGLLEHLANQIDQEDPSEDFDSDDEDNESDNESDHSKDNQKYNGRSDSAKSKEKSDKQRSVNYQTRSQAAAQNKQNREDALNMKLDNFMRQSDNPDALDEELALVNKSGKGKGPAFKHHQSKSAQKLQDNSSGSKNDSSNNNSSSSLRSSAHDSRGSRKSAPHSKVYSVRHK